MALGVLSTPNIIQQRQPARAAPQLSQHLIEAKVSVAGRAFCTLIREGASVNELIEKVAKENGGWVEKKYYPEFKTWEITKVQIGDVLLVKGKEGGIHFGLGTSGIPLASAGEQIIFPNAEELRVGKDTSTIGLWLTPANFDPSKVGDLNPIYSSNGGIRLSEDARKKMEESHGGMRSEKLLLDGNLLVLDRETGEIRTASEHAAKIAVEGFAAPQFQTPTYTSVGLTMSSDRGALALPMDGSPLRVPYLFVKAFDGRITDHISVQFNPIRAYDAALHKPKETVQNRSDATSLHFSVLCRDAPASDSTSPFVQPPAMTPSKKAKLHPLHSPIAPETIRYYWRNPRPALREDAGTAISRKLAPIILEKLQFLGVLFMLRRLLEKREPAAREEAGKNKAQPEARAPRRRKRRPAPSMCESRKTEGKKAKPALRPSLSRPPHAPAKRKKTKLADEPKARAAPKGVPLTGSPRVKRNSKKRMHAYFLMGLLGLLPKRKRRFSRGRAAAGN